MLRATDMRVTEGLSVARLWEDGKGVGELKLKMGGRHNLLNALGAAASARALGAEWDDIKTGLSNFRGVERRFQLVGEVKGVVVIDDYAHHPELLPPTAREICMKVVVWLRSFSLISFAHSRFRPRVRRGTRSG